MKSSRTSQPPSSARPIHLLIALSFVGAAACHLDEQGPAGFAGGLGTPSSTGTGGAAAGGGYGGHDAQGGGSASAGGRAGLGTGGQGAGSAGFGGGLICDGPGARFVTDVLLTSYGPGQGHGRDQMPDVVFGPPRGGGCCTGSMDVVSLGNGGEIVVSFAGNAIVDGAGPDFVVFENAFHVGGNPASTFAELATVAVSDDGQTWTEFPCTAVAAPYGSCAGWHPVLLDGDDGPIDPDTCGGDAFDLAEIGVASARYVRITDRADLDGLSGVFDLDAVGIIHSLCP